MKFFRFFIPSAIMIIESSFANLVRADNYANTIKIFKKSKKQAKTIYMKGMAIFVHAKGGLMYEATIGGQKFSFKAK